MDRQLPVYRILGTEFLVDVVNDQLQQLNDPANTISFSDLAEECGHYLLCYDRITKSLADKYSQQSRHIVELQLPQKTVLDPEGMARLYRTPVERLKGKEDTDPLSDTELLKNDSRSSRP